MARENEKVYREGNSSVHRKCENCETIAIIVENNKYYCAPCMLRKEGIVPLTNSMISEKNIKTSN